MDSRDLEIVFSQLGRRPDNVLEVVYRCPFDRPVVIKSFPVRYGKPFPTLYWLTCPHLRKEVSRLEEMGWIALLERIVDESEEFRERLFRAHEEVRKRRDELISGETAKLLSKVGSGGIENWHHIKCLHLHLADFLAGIDNPVGEFVWNALENKFCKDDMCGGSVETDG